VFEWLSSPEAWVALATLTALEIVLGIDNIIFISILVSRLPPHQRETARRLGIGFALLTRLGLLFTLSLIIRLTTPLFTVLGEEISGRDLVLLGGGLFLLAKSTHEMHNLMEHVPGREPTGKAASGMLSVIVQIAILDIVFSLDSVITAVGLVDELAIMVIAICIAVLVMLLSARALGEFIDRNPTLKVLALSFLMMIGLMLVVESFDVHVPKGYIYFAMAFSIFVETINIRVRNRYTQGNP
jgi:predicted tellurium resistance membrane protein TerC